MKRIALVFACFLCGVLAAQCPIISLPATLQIGCSSGQTVAATANYTTNIVSRWIGPGNVPIVSSGGAPSIAYLDYVSTFTVEFTDTLSKCIVTNTIQTTAIIGKPVFTLATSQNFSLGCGSFSTTTINILNASSTGTDQIPNNGPVTFTLLGPGIFPPSGSFTINTCGIYTLIVRDNNNSCASSYNFMITCTKLAPLTSLSVSPNVTICPGSAAVLTASGASSYSWSNGQTGPSIMVTPAIPTVYSVKGFAIDNCYQTTNVSVGLHSTCVDVFEATEVWKNLIVFPNPAKDQITLKGISNQLNYTFKDLMGRVVLSGLAGDQDKIDVGMLPSGSYLLSLEASGASKYLKLLIFD